LSILGCSIIIIKFWYSIDGWMTGGLLCDGAPQNIFAIWPFTVLIRPCWLNHWTV